MRIYFEYDFIPIKNIKNENYPLAKELFESKSWLSKR